MPSSAGTLGLALYELVDLNFLLPIKCQSLSCLALYELVDLNCRKWRFKYVVDIFIFLAFNFGMEDICLDL